MLGLRVSLLAMSLVAVVGLSGCGSSGGDSKGTSTTKMSEMKPGKTLDVVSFQGGFGIDFFEEVGKEFADKNNVEVKVSGNPRVWEQLQPRFVGGTPPDLTWPGWGMDYWKLVSLNQLLELDEALDSLAADGKTKWRDTFEPGLLALGQSDGKSYMLPYHMNLNGWWYNKTVFDKNGWTAPKTYEELLTLGEKMKAAGVAPITFQGQYPYYSIFGMVLPWSIAEGGMQALDDMQNLVPGAWGSPAVLKAAQMIDELRVKGFFQKGATAMSHTDSQTEFLQGRAGMITCGTWLYSEMKDVWPDGTVAEFMLPPSPANGKDRGNICGAIEPWVIPAKAKNPIGAIEMYKYMTSPEVAKRFVEEKGTLMSIKGVNESAKLPPHLVVPAKLFGESKAVWAPQFSIWYPSFKKDLEGALSSLMTGEITPEAFAKRCEEAAEKLRKNEKVKKHKYVRG